MTTQLIVLWTILGVIPILILIFLYIVAFKYPNR
jgi:hypothetical protein